MPVIVVRNAVERIGNHLAYVINIRLLGRAAEIAGADAGLLYQQDAVDTLLRQEERAVVIHVLHAVCNGSAEEQAAAFDYALERMAELCRQAEQKRDAQSRLFASLGALSGACALMILW